MIKPVAIATVKATQERYFVYNIASYTNEDKVYALYVNCTGHVTYCSCADWKFRKHDCKHMEDLQAQIDTCKAARKAIAQEKALIAEIVSTLEVERVNDLASIEAKEVALEASVEAVLEAKQEAAMRVTMAAYLTAQSIADDRRGSKEAAFNAVKTVVRTIERFGCRYDEIGNEYQVFEQSIPALPKLPQDSVNLLATFTNGQLLKAAPVVAPKVVNIRANRGFVMAPVAELGGRMVPLAS